MIPISVMNEVPPKTLKKIHTLVGMAADLRRGKDFNITRLTIIKSLCSDPDAAAQFALHIAKKTQQAMKRPGRSPSKTQQRYQRLVGSAVRRMAKHLKEGRPKRNRPLMTYIRRFWASKTSTKINDGGQFAS